MEEIIQIPEFEEIIEAAPMVEEAPQEPEYVEVVDVQFRPGQKVYYFDPAGMDIKQYDHLIIDTARGPEYGICSGGNHKVNLPDGTLKRFHNPKFPEQYIEMIDDVLQQKEELFKLM